jgi:hypothetical protein
MKWNIFLLIPFLSLLFISSESRAKFTLVIEGSEEIAPNKEIRVLVDSYLAALWARDKKKWFSSFHAKSSECINAKTLFYFKAEAGDKFKKYASRDKSYKIIQLLKLPVNYKDPMTDFLTKRGFYSPISATHKLVVDVGKEKRTKEKWVMPLGLTLDLATEKSGAMKVIWPCPKIDSLEEIKQGILKRKKKSE